MKYSTLIDHSATTFFKNLKVFSSEFILAFLTISCNYLFENHSRYCMVPETTNVFINPKTTGIKFYISRMFKRPSEQIIYLNDPLMGASGCSNSNKRKSKI